MPPKRLIVTTSNHVEGHKVVDYLGVVRGIVVRATGFARGIAGSFASIAGGNVTAYEEVCEEARREAYARMREHAMDEGADAIIGMRYDATDFAQGVTEVLAYGTAVMLQKLDEEKLPSVMPLPEEQA